MNLKVLDKEYEFEGSINGITELGLILIVPITDKITKLLDAICHYSIIFKLDVLENCKIIEKKMDSVGYAAYIFITTSYKSPAPVMYTDKNGIYKWAGWM
jgi:hypothetical protein